MSHTPATLDDARAELGRRCNTIEEAYEFMLAYAAQGMVSDAHNSQVREFLRKCDGALADLPGFLKSFVGHLTLDSDAPYTAFLNVLERDARDARAAVQLVLAQPAISSQLVDNLNASIHLRALLTDLFLIDEILRAQKRSA